MSPGKETTLADDLSRNAGWLGTGCGILFILPFIGGGIGAMVAGFRGLQRGEENAFVGLAVGGLFLVVGIGIAALLFLGIRRTKFQHRAKELHPSEPWKWKQEWSTGEIHADSGAGVWFAGFFALIWNAIAWTVLLAVWDDISRGDDRKVYFIFIFPVVGLFLFSWFVYGLLRQRKYGTSVFKMTTIPGVLGGTVQGLVEVPRQIDPEQGFKVRLLCVHRYTSGSGKNRSTREDTRWEKEKTITRDLLAHDPNRTGIPVFFNVPYDLPPSKEGNPGDIWRLQVSAEVAGVDYHAQFELPVFKTADSDPKSIPADDPTLQFQAHGGEFRWPAHAAIRVHDSGGTLDVHFPAARNKGVLFFLFVFLLIWNGVIWFMIAEKAPLIFPIVFGFFDLFLLLFFFSSLFCSSRIRVDATQLVLRKKFLLIPTGTRTFSPAEIQQVELDSGMQSGDKRYYQIKIRGSDGRDTKIAGGIRDKKQAEWLIQQVNARLGRWDGGNAGASIRL